jgi:NAD(P)-dependent dehydrogenase (short-subunit alcohol dehydrogenase family)
MVLAAAREGHNVAFTFKSNDRAADDIVRQVAAQSPDVRCKAYALDVVNPAAVETCVDTIVADFGHVDVLVNNAGVTRDNLVVSMSDDEWNEVLATNLTGPFLMIRQLLPVFMARRFGRIINVSSVVSHGGSGQANYAAAKGGLNALTQTIAKEYGRKGITCNAVLPGFFDTDLTRESLPPSARDFWKSFCPMPKGRMGDPSELADVVLYLASAKASFINGELISVTGGLNATV